VARLTPNLVRVTVSGPELEGFASNGPAEHIRIWFPKPGQSQPLLPVWGPTGPLPFKEGDERPVSRVYTPRRFDPQMRELDIDFVLHEDGQGPGLTWIRNAKAGDTLVVTGPGGPYKTDLGAAWYVLAGDHAALPAICTILDTLPAGAPAQVYVEVASAAEEIALESAAEFTVTWLHGGDEPRNAGRLLASTLKDTPFPAGDGRVFVACEAGVMRDIRRHLLYERGLSRDVIHTHGYWKYGAENHPDHDLGLDVDEAAEPR
jgi:NADPH-dependent ferric siderophore reductase